MKPGLFNSQGRVIWKLSLLLNLLTLPFYISAQFSHVTNNGTITITGYSGTNATASIPEEINGLRVTQIGSNAFSCCTLLKEVILGHSITRIGNEAFKSCSNLTGIYFSDNAPQSGTNLFQNSSSAVSYFLPGTTGWSNSFAGRPAMLWRPMALPLDSSLGVHSNLFGFNIVTASNMVIVVEASTNLATNSWFPIQTNSFHAGSSFYTHAQWAAYQRCVYRLVYTITSLSPTNMTPVVPGTFSMGDSMNEISAALPVHNVTLSPFHMDKYEVTKALWDTVYNWAINHQYDFENAGSGKNPTHPVHTINWYDAVKWCNARSEMEGKIPAYYTSANMTAVYRSGWIDLDNGCVKWNAGYRLPTEAEWEFAARGGASARRFPWPDVDTISHSQANYRSASSTYDVSPTSGYHPLFTTNGYPYTSPVGSFQPNGHGLYDMAGNVAEWCWDWHDAYSSKNQIDPHGPNYGDYRSIRGGLWYYYASYCRVAFRDNDYPDFAFDGIGFRTLLPSP